MSRGRGLLAVFIVVLIAEGPRKNHRNLVTVMPTRFFKRQDGKGVTLENFLRTILPRTASAIGPEGPDLGGSALALGCPITI